MSFAQITCCNKHRTCRPIGSETIKTIKPKIISRRCHLPRLRQIRHPAGYEVTVRRTTCSGTNYMYVQSWFLQRSVRRSTSANTIAPLQRVQNAPARPVFQLEPRDHITQGLRELHWLPICARVQSTDGVCDVPPLMKHTAADHRHLLKAIVTERCLASRPSSPLIIDRRLLCKPRLSVPSSNRKLFRRDSFQLLQLY